MADENADFIAFVDEFLRGYTSKGINGLRAYKATAAARRQRLQEELTGISRDGFIDAWAHDDHWEAAARALKK